MKNVFLMTLSLKSFPMVPYATGCLISHCLTDPDIQREYNFLEPEYRHNCENFNDFHEKLKKSDIIGLTCYVWNQTSNDRISKLFKKINPNGIVVYGGPNIPEDKLIAESYISDRPFVDFFFVGPGEKNFLNFLKNIKNKNHIGAYSHVLNDHFEIKKSDYKIENIPTPYIDGIFDNIFKKEKRIFAPIESNRGCPYGCSFCDWGSLTRNKVTLFDINIVKKNIDKLLSFDSLSGINIIDANFGMFLRDVEIFNYLCDKKSKNNKSIELLFSGTSKNGSKYLTEIYKKMHLFEVGQSTTTSKNIKISFQTFSQQALESVDRKNMTIDKLTKIIDSTKYNTVSSELIIGLPGETVSSWIDTISQHKDLNLTFGRVYHLNILPNTPMYQSNYRKKYQTTYTKVYIPIDLIDISFIDSVKVYKKLKNIKSKYTFNIENKLNFETFEIMRSSFSYSNEQLKEMYLYYFWFNTFWNTNLLKKEIVDHKLTIKEQIFTFFKFAESSVFCKKIVEDYKELLDTVFVDKDLNILNDLKSVIFLHKNMGRGTELLEIVDNIEEFSNEIKQIYPSFNRNKIKKFDTLEERKKLLSAYVVLC